MIRRNRLKKIGYNSKYWKITDNKKLDIFLRCCEMNSNEKCYYIKMDR